MDLRVDHRELGGGWLEAYLELDEISAYLALQTGLPEATIRAHVIAAAGHCERPPKWKEAYFLLNGELYVTDSQHIKAMRRVIFDYVPESEVQLIVDAFLADRYGMPGTIAMYQLNEDIHHSVVRAVLEELDHRGRLPLHPSHFYGA